MNKEDKKVWSDLRDALASLKINRPNDRSDKDRRYAVTITEMEKVVSYYYLFIVSEDIVQTPE